MQKNQRNITKKNLNDHELAILCQNRDAQAQYVLYQRYSGKMMAVCLRYARSRDEAEDFLQDGFIRIFDHLHQYRHEGSFEGWIKRIMVTSCINHIRTRHKETGDITIDDYLQETLGDGFENYDSHFELKDLRKMIQELPDQYRTVFNLYVIDGYNHQEIAKMLGIQEGSSKSNLSRARKILARIIQEKDNFIHDELRRNI